MDPKTDIELRFSHPEDLPRAYRMARAMVTAWFRNGCEFPPFADMRKENADGWVHYPGRYVSREQVGDFRALWSVCRMEGRPSRREPLPPEGEELLRRIRTRDGRFEFRDCDGILQERQIEHRYFEDFFSLFCFLLAVESPDHPFEGLRRTENPDGLPNRVLTRAVYDGTSLTFEQMEGLSVYGTCIVSWTRREEVFLKRSWTFPCIRVDLLTGDRDAVRKDPELERWLRAVNEVQGELISAELRFLHPSFHQWPTVLLQGAARASCVRLRDELTALLAKQGIGTQFFSILRPGECSGTELVIPDSVTLIGDNAFRCHRALRRVVIPEGVREIGEHAFCGCTALEEVVLPQSTSKIAPGAFFGCPDSLLLRGVKGSAAERFAKRQGIAFQEQSGK